MRQVIINSLINIIKFIGIYIISFSISVITLLILSEEHIYQIFFTDIYLLIILLFGYVVANKLVDFHPKIIVLFVIWVSIYFGLVWEYYIEYQTPRGWFGSYWPVQIHLHMLIGAILALSLVLFPRIRHKIQSSIIPDRKKFAILFFVMPSMWMILTYTGLWAIFALNN